MSRLRDHASWLHGNSIGIDTPLPAAVAFFKWGSLKLLSPLASMISCRMLWTVVHTAPSFSDFWAAKAVLTSAMRSSIVLGVVRSCRDCMELKNPRSRMFRSGLLGGWLMNLMSQPSAVHSLTMSGSSLRLCDGALSC